MKLSARNQLAGTVEAIETGAVTSTVKVRLASGEIITSSVTIEAVTDLGLEEGSPVTVVIKSSDVILATS